MSELQANRTASSMPGLDKVQGLDELGKLATWRALAPRQQLFAESEPADHVFKVTAGVLKAYKLLRDGRCQVTGFFFPGDFLGIELNRTYLYGADAVTRATVARFKRKAFQELIRRRPDLEHWLLGLVTHELSVAQDQMLLLGRENATERVASFLLMLSERAVARGESGNPVYVPMLCTDVGDFLGLAIETVSRTYGWLHRRGIISRRSRNKVRILNWEALVRIREGTYATHASTTRREGAEGWWGQVESLRTSR